MKNNRAKN